MKQRPGDTRTMRVLAVSLAGITAIFLASFILTVLAEGNESYWLGLVWFVAPAAMALLAGRLAPSGWPAVAGAVVALLCWIAMLYGVYLAYLTGWGGLDVSDFSIGEPSDAQEWIVVAVLSFALPVMSVGAALGLVGTFRR